MIRNIAQLLIFTLPVFSLGAQSTDSLTIDKRDSLSFSNQQWISEVSVQVPFRISNQYKWTGSYSKLNSKQLRKGNAYNLQQQLNKIPGVMMQQGTMSTNRITIRGIGSRTPYQTNRIKAYWGEMPLTDGDGATSLEDIGLNDMSALEVIKGSSSALYGAGMGGVILLNPFVDKNHEPGVTLKSEAGNYGTFSQHAQINWDDKKNGHYTWVGGAIHSDGYRQNSVYKRYNSTLKGQKKVGRHLLRFLYNYKYLNGEIPSSLDSIDFKFNPQKAADSWNNIEGYEETTKHMISLGLVSPIGHNIANTLTLFGKISDLDELRPFNRLEEERRSLGLRNRLSTSLGILKLTLGTEMMTERSDISLFSVRGDNVGKQLSTSEYQRYYYNVFALVEANPTSDVVVQAAINYNQTGYKALQESFSFKYSPVWSPKLGVNYSLTEGINLFASVGHGFSAPSLEEAQLPDGSFNPDIKPEEGWNYETGIRFNKYQKLYTHITLYQMKMNNLLVTERDAEDQFYGKNAGKTTHKGIELGMTWNILKPLPNKKLTLNASYFTSENTFDQFVHNGNNYKNKDLPGIPSSNWSAELEGSYKFFDYSLSHIHYGKQYLNDANTRRYASYHKTNAKVSVKIERKKLKYRIYLGVDNLLDTHYTSMVLVNAKAFGNNLPRYFYPGLPFNMFGGIELIFQ